MPDNNTKRENELGALWTKQGKKGQYFSGYVEVDGQKIPIVVFSNSKKSSEKQPDYTILKSEGKPQATTGQPTEERQGDAPPF